MQGILFILFFVLSSQCSFPPHTDSNEIKSGAEQTDLYFNDLRAKKVALLGNQSSLVKGTHLLDSLISSGIKLEKIFSPEHGFRGSFEDGALIDNNRDEKTGLQIISLYGKNRKPSPSDLMDLDIILFDLQDVGTRFYTYISTLHYVMEACAESGIQLIILDRPNPNGDYIDGPVLEETYRSFVGMHPIPVLHGMTLGEYAQMINGEGWLKEGIKCRLEVIPCENYRHDMAYKPPVNPSPNLPDYQSVRLYPSLCFFEGTAISIGRGTDFPFQVFGHPEFPSTGFIFTPESRPGFSTNPKLKGQACNAYDLRSFPADPGQLTALNLQWLITAYNSFPQKDKFFTSYFELLAGTDKLRKQIMDGTSEEEIKESWQPGLKNFRQIRNKYLIY